MNQLTRRKFVMALLASPAAAALPWPLPRRRPLDEWRYEVRQGPLFVVGGDAQEILFAEFADGTRWERPLR